MEKEELHKIMTAYGLTFQQITGFCDTSHSENDRRLNYMLDNRYVLKIHSACSMWEDRLQEISRLIDRYRSVGVYCPRMIPTVSGSFSCPYEMDGQKLNCFLEAYSIYPICECNDQLDRKEVVAHLGLLADRYTGVDLSETYDMWSIFELSPLDQVYGIDEKQANADLLTDALKEVQLASLAEDVANFNHRLRLEIQNGFRELPRCVYQGDLNYTNYLQKDGHFAGLIDFNLSGTDVNINEFVNETNWFATTEEFDKMSVSEILSAIDAEQSEVLDVILSNYSLNPLEQKMLPYFKGISDLFQYPNVCQLVEWLRDETRREKAVKLIEEMMKKV